IPLILVLTSVLGLLVGLMIHIFKIQPFIATLAAMFLARGLCYVISKDSISITDPVFVSLAQTRISFGGRPVRHASPWLVRWRRRSRPVRRGARYWCGRVRR
ncbi:hypothetical protein QN346_21090, partial [Undibacterium sp. 5I1]|nr:hypothetical protein [Undibacterium sp. 5I1]